jgi:hypothetical protein
VEMVYIHRICTVNIFMVYKQGLPNGAIREWENFEQMSAFVLDLKAISYVGLHIVSGMHSIVVF